MTLLGSDAVTWPTRRELAPDLTWQVKSPSRDLEFDPDQVGQVTPGHAKPSLRNTIYMRHKRAMPKPECDQIVHAKLRHAITYTTVEIRP